MYKDFSKCNPDCCYGNRSKVHNEKTLCTDWPWTMFRMHTKTTRSQVCFWLVKQFLFKHKISVLIAVLGRKVYRVLSSPHTTDSSIRSSIFPMLDNQHMRLFPLTKYQSNLRRKRFQDIEEMKLNATWHLFASLKRISRYASINGN